MFNCAHYKLTIYIFGERELTEGIRRTSKLAMYVYSSYLY